MGSIGFSGNLQNVNVLQVINVHKCDTRLHQIETSPRLGQSGGGVGRMETRSQTGTRPDLGQATGCLLVGLSSGFSPSYVLTLQMWSRCGLLWTIWTKNLDH
jgi:hypothetical protein